MKGGLCVIYTSLLTISLVSSCALFLLVVSEALNAESTVDKSVDLSGLHNVSQRDSKDDKYDKPTTPAGSSEPSKIGLEPPQPVEDHEMTFPEMLSLNSVTTDGLPDTGQPPVLISLADNAKMELRNPDDLLFVNDSEEHNDTIAFTVKDETVNRQDEREVIEEEKESTEPRLVIKATPMHEIKQVDEAFQTSTTIEPDATESQSDVQKDIETENIPTKPETPQEDIPSFSEWAQKQLAEAEKKDTVLNHSSQPSHSNTNFSSKNTKLRSKNYASLACGAKVVAVNPEAGSVSSILSPNTDEYMLNTCTSRIWFVVELCEAVQAQKIEIANFELFSSSPKDFAVYFSDRFPTRDWASVGQFTAQYTREVQSFDLYPHLFGKFIKVEMLSHYGSEHYCPISLFKVYGTSEFEVLEKENSQHPTHIDEDEDDEMLGDLLDVPAAEIEPSKNLFGSARDAVMSIMKAAQALVKTEVPKNVSSAHNDTTINITNKRCCSPSHIIVCDNCSETLYDEVYELISCNSDKLVSLVRQVFLRETLKCTNICQPFGLDFKSTKTIEFSNERIAYINALLPQNYLAALCNILAIKEKKVVLNTSFETELNVTVNVTVDETPQTVNGEIRAEQEIKLVPDKDSGSFDDTSNETILTEENLVPEVTTESPVIVDLPKDDESTDVKEDSITFNDNPVQEQQQTISSETEKYVDSTDNEIRDNAQKNEIKNGKSEIDKPKDTTNGDDINDTVVMDSESFLSDFEQIAVDPTPAGVISSPNQNHAQATLQKESVFLRLSNRVKTLERNMSLSGQYLEELSRRYKKQVEEMQKTFEKTVQQMTDERRKSNEREQKYLEQMANLQEQLGQMALGLKVLLEERDSWLGSVTFLRFIAFQAIIVAGVLYFVTKNRKVEPIIVPIPRKTKKKPDRLRRKSVEGVSGHKTPKNKKRRPSEEAMVITRQSVDTNEAEEGEWQVAKKNRRRKTSILPGSEETEKRYVREDSIRKLQNNPIALDEEEFYAPVSEPKQFETEVVEVKKELPKTNGSFFNNLKTKTMKTRRLSSPAFLRTLSRQSSRSTPSPVVMNSESMYNGNMNKKASSESPTGSLWSESTEISQNGQQETESGGKKKKSLKNILKKVF